MKLTNKKKGFTIVELVIVIAVIAILAAVLIPNLSALVTKANKSAAMQEARSTYTTLLTEDGINADLDYCSDASKPDLYVKVTKGNVDYYFAFTDGTMAEEPATAAPTAATASTEGYVALTTPEGYTNVFKWVAKTN